MSTPNIPADVKTEIMFRNQFEMWRNIYRDLGEKPTLMCKADKLVKFYPQLEQFANNVCGLHYLNIRFDDECLMDIKYFTDHLYIDGIGIGGKGAIRIPYTEILGVRAMSETFVHRVDASLALFPSAGYNEREPLIYGHQFTAQPAIEEKVTPPERPRPVLTVVK